VGDKHQQLGLHFLQDFFEVPGQVQASSIQSESKTGSPSNMASYGVSWRT
jgi:hypothetical protein